MRTSKTCHERERAREGDRRRERERERARAHMTVEGGQEPKERVCARTRHVRRAAHSCLSHHIPRPSIHQSIHFSLSLFEQVMLHFGLREYKHTRFRCPSTFLLYHGPWDCERVSAVCTALLACVRQKEERERECVYESKSGAHWERLPRSTSCYPGVVCIASTAAHEPRRQQNGTIRRHQLVSYTREKREQEERNPFL